MLEVFAKCDGVIPLDVSFQVKAGQVLALVGPSGSGKSTLLRTIAGLHVPRNARVVVNGEVWLDTEKGINVPTYKRNLGKVFQNYALFPHMDATGNIAAALGDLPRENRATEARRLLKLVNLGDVGNHLPAALSGGQQQRVAVARALAGAPQTLLLDEPFSAVDRDTRERLYQEISALRQVLNVPVVLVTHEMNEAQMLADNMVVIEAGRMVASGPANEVMSNPEALRGIGRRETAGIIDTHIAAHEGDGLTRLDHEVGSLWIPRIEGEVGTGVRMRIMAHEVILSRVAPEGLSALNILPATICALTQGDGPATLVELKAGRDTIVARITNRSLKRMQLATGDTCYVILKSMSVAQGHVGLRKEQRLNK